MDPDTASMPRPQPIRQVSAATGPLAGVRILDLTSVVMGPYATQLLGDMGADVITVEPPRGETNRAMGPGPLPQLSGVALNLLRNKRNVTLDFKHPDGHRALLDVAATCEVFVTNLRPGTLTRARLAYDDVAAVRPDVVYCQAHGYATGTPRQDEAAYDDVIQAETGIADAAARVGGQPQVAPTIMADKVCGLTIALSVAAALYRRALTGEGEHIEVPMADTVTAFMLVEHGSSAIPRPPLGPAGYPRILNPYRRPWRTKDGWIMVLPYTREQYDAIFASARPDLLGDERYSTGRKRIANAAFLYEQIGQMLPERTTKEWVDFFREHDVPAAAVASLDDLVEGLPDALHPHAGAHKVIPPPVRFAGAPQSVRRPAPLIGEHTAEVLAEVGYDEGKVASLRASGALGHVPAEFS
ncbi:MAG: CaiB/BaiF CoA transferase family protein [Acidimicrobiales bacterium]